MTPTIAPELELDLSVKHKTVYAYPLELRDLQIRANILRVPGRIQKEQGALRTEPIAIVCYGPSLVDTWEQVKDFRYVMTCSGAHRFLIDRGIIPTYHIDVDPRPHKATLIGTPHPDVEYLMASTCHREVFDLLEGFNVKLWHIFDNAEEGLRILPHGEVALTGGPGAGLRAMTVARFLGFTDQHIFGMDGSDGPTGKHAGAHPMQAQKRMRVVVDGRPFYTIPSFAECAKATFRELDAMPDVKATFYGDGLVQQLAKSYVPKHGSAPANLAICKPELISATARSLNAQLHRDNLTYGLGGDKHKDAVLALTKSPTITSVLDYGCGKGMLARALPFPIWEYDPAIPGKDAAPRPADLVVCTDVLEHVEDGKVQFVLGDIRRCVQQLGYFVIHLGPASKTYADGRNTHLTQRKESWWVQKLAQYFTIGKTYRIGPKLHVIVGVKGAAQAPQPMLTFDRLTVIREPYPVGRAEGVLEPSLYATLAASFPSADLFRSSTAGSGNLKLTLSETSRETAYHAFVAAHPAWQSFHTYVKSPAFITQMLALLAQQHIPMPLTREPLSARFEFSMLPADGGCLLPHTDIPEKLITVVVAMRQDGDGWDDAWGGGTAILKPIDGLDAPPQDYKASLASFEEVAVMPYQPNAATVFVKTDTSWHAVGPLTGPANTYRKSVTINIEYAAASAKRQAAIRQAKAEGQLPA